MPACVISFKMTDDEDFSTTLPIHYDVSEVNTVAEAQGIATDLAPMISAISGSKVVGAKVEFPLTVPADIAADAGSRNDAGATLSFYNSAGKASSIYIPAFLADKITAGKVDYDTTPPNLVDTFIAAITAGTGVTGAFIATDGNALKLTSYRAGRQSTRKALRTR